MDISILIPAKNEAQGLEFILPKLIKRYPDAEILVIDDGSQDNTKTVCHGQAVSVISHAYSMGNGAAIKSGIRAASGDILVFMDGDGQHDPDDISKLLDKLESGFDMVVGARSWTSQTSLGRLCANTFYNWFASFMVGHKIDDLTSGLRAVKAKKIKEFLYLLPNGFSYPTTVTMAFFRSGFAVGYEPITAKKRIGNSHISLLKDGIKFILIIFKISVLYSPLKLFAPTALLCASVGVFYYLYTYLTDGRFTNMGVLLFSTALLVFLIGLVSEQITTLLYTSHKDD